MTCEVTQTTKDIMSKRRKEKMINKILIVIKVIAALAFLYVAVGILAFSYHISGIYGI